MSSFIRRFSTKEDVEKAKLRGKASAEKEAEGGGGGGAAATGRGKASEFDVLLRSGETILLAMTPPSATGAPQRTPVRVGNNNSSATMVPTAAPQPQAGKKGQRDSLEDAVEKMTTVEPAYREQRATISHKPAGITTSSLRRVLSNESMVSLAESTDSDKLDTTQTYLRTENMRLEKRIQELNSELFKERAANAELSTEVKEALAQLERMQKQETPQPLSAAVATGGPAGSPALAALPSVDVGSNDWPKKYAELEARSNALSAKAVQTIQESKLKLTALQRENLELKDQVRELQVQLQQHSIEKGRAMSLIPRLVEMVQKLQKEIGEEKQKRHMESEFDDLTRLVQRPAAAGSAAASASQPTV